MADDDRPGESPVDAPGGDWLDDHVELYAVDVLTADEAARVETELEALPAVARTIYDARIADTRQAIARMAAGYALDAPEELRAHVLERVFSEDTADPAESTPTRADGTTDPADGTTSLARRREERDARRRRLLTAVAAAALVAAVALGAGILIGRSTAPEPTPPTATSQPDQQVVDVLAAPDAKVSFAQLGDDRGSLSVVTSRSQNRAVAVVRDPRNPLAQGQTFQLWLVGKAATPVSAGLVGTQGLRSPVLVDQLDASQVLAITIEPDGGSPQPTTPILAQIAL